MLHIAQNIRRVRLLKGDTQPQFAKRIGIKGVTNDMVSSWERDIVPPNEVIIERIAKIAGVTAEMLMNEDISHKITEVLDPETKQMEFKITPINGVNQHEQELEHLRELLKERDERLKEKDERIKLLTQLLEKSSKKS